MFKRRLCKTCNGKIPRFEKSNYCSHDCIERYYKDGKIHSLEDYKNKKIQETENITLKISVSEARLIMFMTNSFLETLERNSDDSLYTKETIILKDLYFKLMKTGN